LDENKAYYERSLEKIWNKITSQEEEIKRLKEENQELKEKLEKENKHLKGRIIKLENTLK
jgi:predicted phage-related endonuclease